MAQEIEKKFLVTGDYKPSVTKHFRITQGYLSSSPERTVRVRIKDNTGFLTIKGIGNRSGTTRFEWEKEITEEEARELLKICEPGLIDKTRFIIPEMSGLEFEVDEFYGDNEGLVIAEIELPSEDHEFNAPNWVGKEVTGDTRYYNSKLLKYPYKNW
ncbi:MAG: adenylate cyclase [Lentimicrobiaceae bacterium]|jgi:adenylate cyclase|nr:adenylate cyclase [Lentimicrobiaceae bacterium]MDG1902411.1 CYTH domain-containing protein [Bacteroidales bacterium]MDG2081885.1 CYTH domain-containing protein [Bacteroidales bacterium]|tara:strand:- start:292 stop:762 length:471 start_codon:yes stop_codon:yes gene_type:complete